MGFKCRTKSLWDIHNIMEKSTTSVSDRLIPLINLNPISWCPHNEARGIIKNTIFCFRRQNWWRWSPYLSTPHSLMWKRIIVIAQDVYRNCTRSVVLIHISEPLVHFVLFWPTFGGGVERIILYRPKYLDLQKRYSKSKPVCWLQSKTWEF